MSLRNIRLGLVPLVIILGTGAIYLTSIGSSNRSFFWAAFYALAGVGSVINGLEVRSRSANAMPVLLLLLSIAFFVLAASWARFGFLSP